MTSFNRDIVYLERTGPHVDAAISGLTSAGYTVHHVTNAALFEQLVYDLGPEGTDSLCALVIDLQNGEQAAAALNVVASDPRLGELPSVHLIEPDQEAFGGHRVMTLKRPVPPPALVRVINYAVATPSTSSDSGTARTMTTPAPTSMLESTAIGDYELIEQIAVGGMGTVFLAQRHQGGLHRLYAIKLMHVHLVDDQSVRGMFVDEATLASRIHHPNVAAIVDLGTHNGRPFVVLQYVEGCSLAKLFKGIPGPCPTGLVMSVVVDALAGLHAAHTLSDDDGRPLGFIHRDVAPDNVLVGLDGVGRLTDFGVAKAHGRITSTRNGVRKGKPSFLAPEQLLDSPNVDARADIFSMGAVLWNGLTGKRLFSAQSPAAVLRNVLEGPIVAPSTLNPSVPKALDRICLRALSRDLSERYPSAQAMADDLRAADRELGLMAPPKAVGEWVERVHGDKLRQRRRTIQRARIVRTQDSGAHELALARTGTNIVDAQTHVDLPIARAPSGPTSIPANKHRRNLGTVGALLSGVLLSATAVFMCDLRPDDPPAAQQPSLARSTVVPPLRSIEPPPPTTLQPPRPPVSPPMTQTSPAEAVSAPVEPKANSETGPGNPQSRATAEPLPKTTNFAPKVADTQKPGARSKTSAKRRRRARRRSQQEVPPSPPSAAAPPAEPPTTSTVDAQTTSTVEPPPTPELAPEPDPLTDGPEMNPYRQGT